jgi:hypothetical protein
MMRYYKLSSITALFLFILIIRFPQDGNANAFPFFNTYTGINRCTLTTNRDGEQWAEM